MKKIKYFCTIKLYQLSRKICNRSTNVEVKGTFINTLEALYLIKQIRDDKYKTLPKYLEVSEYWFTLVSKFKVNLAGDELRDTYILELESRKEINIVAYLKLKVW